MSGAADLKLETLRLEQDGRVLVARVDDPPYNFMTARMQRDLDALTRAVDDDVSVGVVILTGNTPDRYITHFNNADILTAAQQMKRPLSEPVVRAAIQLIAVVSRVPGGRKFIERTPLRGLLNVTRFSDVVMRIMRSPAVYIAAVNGPCGGGGIEMSVCFDVRIASETAGFAIPELLIGLTTTVGGQRLSRLVGLGKALEMTLEGRMYSAHEALEMGLVTRVVPPEQLVETAKKLAAHYATRNRLNIAAQKRIFNEDALRSPSSALLREGAANVSGILGGPAPRALRAWVEMQRRGGGESPFLTKLDVWTRGNVVNLNPDGGDMRDGPAVVDGPDGADVVDTLEGLRPRPVASPAASAAH
jgi:enoyl-CoA hydratase/carnithine racemase